ncbi:MAG: hypothetical protein M3O67_03390, partial [Bacteroidota bacterium]|nr:hypothetical protein [Bacteroidota bacterium]
GLDKDFGDVNESALASALRYINTGAFRTQATTSFSENQQVVNSNKILDEPLFKGTVDIKRKF